VARNKARSYGGNGENGKWNSVENGELSRSLQWKKWRRIDEASAKIGCNVSANSAV